MLHVNLLAYGITKVIIDGEVHADGRLPKRIGDQLDANEFRQLAICRFDHLSTDQYLTYDYYLAITADETILIVRPISYVHEIRDGYWVVKSYDDGIMRVEAVYENQLDAIELFRDVCREDHESVTLGHIVAGKTVPADTIVYCSHDLMD